MPPGWWQGAQCSKTSGAMSLLKVAGRARPETNNDATTMQLKRNIFLLRLQRVFNQFFQFRFCQRRVDKQFLPGSGAKRDAFPSGGCRHS